MKYKLLLFLLLVGFLLTTASANEGGVYHEVKEGQTLWDIAQLYGTSIDELVQYNRIDMNAGIEKGQLLYIEKKGLVSSKKSHFSYPLKEYRNHVNACTLTQDRLIVQLSSSATIVASRSGNVSLVIKSHFFAYHNMIILDHHDGYYTVYSGLDKIDVVEGDRIAQGESIGGLRPEYDKKSSFHFEIRKKNKKQNLFYFLPS